MLLRAQARSLLPLTLDTETNRTPRAALVQVIDTDGQPRAIQLQPLVDAQNRDVEALAVCAEYAPFGGRLR